MLYCTHGITTKKTKTRTSFSDLATPLTIPDKLRNRDIQAYWWLLVREWPGQHWQFLRCLKIFWGGEEGSSPSQQYFLTWQPFLWGGNGILRKLKTMLSVNWKLETFSVKAEPLFRQLYLHQIFYSKTLHLKPLLRQKGVTKNLNIFHRGFFESFRATPTAEAIWQIHLCEKLTETCKKYRMEFGCGFVQSFTVIFSFFFGILWYVYA